MVSERDFLHLISNYVAAAKVSTELSREMAEEAPAPPIELRETLDAALSALTKLTQAIQERRISLTAENPSSPR